MMQKNASSCACKIIQMANLECLKHNEIDGICHMIKLQGIIRNKVPKTTGCEQVQGILLLDTKAVGVSNVNGCPMVACRSHPLRDMALPCKELQKFEGLGMQTQKSKCSNALL